MESETRPPEFQVVICIEFDDGRMFPLTRERPVCLLPIANISVLEFQLSSLEGSGVLEVFIVTPPEYFEQLASLPFRQREGMSVEIVAVEDSEGSADNLRAVKDRIRGDFLFISSDVVFKLALGDLINFHRKSAADITTVLSGLPIDEPEKKGGIMKVRVDDMDQEYVGIGGDGRLVMKIPAVELLEAEAGSDFELHKSLLHRCQDLTVRTDLLDVGFYVMSHWVLEFVGSQRKITSIRGDLLPLLIGNQFQPRDLQMATFPPLRHRNRVLCGVERWQARQASASWGVNDLGSLVLESAIVSNDEGDVDPTSPDDDLIRMFAMTVEISDCSSAPKAKHQITPYIQKLTSIPQFLLMNREIPSQMPLGSSRALDSDTASVTSANSAGSTSVISQASKSVHISQSSRSSSALWPSVSGYTKKELSVIGEVCTIGDKVTIKQCSVGSNCHIGARAKLNNSVLMDGVTIGDGCVVQNTVVCAGATIEQNCNVNDCSIGAGVRVAAGSKLKGEAVSDN